MGSGNRNTIGLAKLDTGDELRAGRSRMAHDGPTNPIIATNSDDSTCRNCVGTSKSGAMFGTIHHLDACVVSLSTILSPGNCELALCRIPHLSAAIKQDFAHSKLAERRLEPCKRTSPNTHASSMTLKRLAV
jgi:hypothetical protein